MTTREGTLTPGSQEPRLRPTLPGHPSHTRKRHVPGKGEAPTSSATRPRTNQDPNDPNHSMRCTLSIFYSERPFPPCKPWSCPCKL